MSAVWFIGFSIAWTALLAGGAHLLSRDPVPAKFAHNIWRGAAALSFLPWILLGLYQLMPTTVATPLQSLPYFSDAIVNLTNPEPVEVSQSAGPSLPIGLMLWCGLIAGWAGRVVLNLISQLRLQRIKRSAIPASHLSAEKFARQLGLRTAPQVWVRETGSPFLAGIGKRKIYIPAATTNLSTAEFIIAHECTHLARGDLITRPLERFTADLFWFSPFAWVIRGQLDYWREAACDAQTLELTGDNVGYARVLAHTARLSRPMTETRQLPVAAFIPSRQAPLKRRLQHILEPAQPQKRRKLTAIACLVGIMLAPLSLAQVTPHSGGHGAFSHPLVISSQARVAAAFGKTDYYGEMKWHAGVDISAPKYACVHAPSDGTVIAAKFINNYGNTLDIALADGRVMRFANLDDMQVDKGAHINAGDVIGTVGQSAGGGTKPHLHFEMFDHGEYLDPTEVEGLTLFARTTGSNSNTSLHLKD